MLKRNIEVFMGCESSFEEAETVLFGAPFDSTTSYRPGTRFGCSTIRHESFGIESYSPYQDKDLFDGRVMDGGDIELPFGCTEDALNQIEERAADILEADKRPFMLGGEHLVTLGAFRAAAKKYPDICIVHFDAHADLREDYLGNRLSHACVLRRCWEIVGDGRIFQFGIRSGDREEFSWGKEHVKTCRFNFDTLEETLDKLGDKPVYFTVDLDVLDPSVFPGTGTPEPGGVTFEEMRKSAVLVCEKANVVACDVNELSPHYDHSGISTAAACKTVREMLLAFQK